MQDLQIEKLVSCDPGVQKAGEDGRCFLPFVGFFFDLLSARSRQSIKLRLPIVGGETPFGSDVSLLFQFEQSRIERSVVEGQKISARPLDLARNPVAM